VPQLFGHPLTRGAENYGDVSQVPFLVGQDF